MAIEPTTRSTGTYIAGSTTYSVTHNAASSNQTRWTVWDDDEVVGQITIFRAADKAVARRLVQLVLDESSSKVVVDDSVVPTPKSVTSERQHIQECISLLDVARRFAGYSGKPEMIRRATARETVEVFTGFAKALNDLIPLSPATGDPLCPREAMAALLETLGLNHTETAQLVGIGQSSVSRYIRNVDGSITVETVQRMWGPLDSAGVGFARAALALEAIREQGRTKS